VLNLEESVLNTLKFRLAVPTGIFMLIFGSVSFITVELDFLNILFESPLRVGVPKEDEMTQCMAEVSMSCYIPKFVTTNSSFYVNSVSKNILFCAFALLWLPLRAF
jgi:hypothetical protein